MCRVLFRYFIIISMTAFIQYCATFSRKTRRNTMCQQYYMEIKPDKRNGGKHINVDTYKEEYILKIDGQTRGLSHNLCFLFVYYVISNKSCMETTLLSIITLLFHKTSAIPINRQENNLNASKTRGERRPRSISNHETPVQGKCLENWFENSEQCYKIFHEIKNYRSAKLHCEALHASLIKVTSKEQNDFIEKFSNEMKIRTYLWISVTPSATYSNWYPGHFNKRNGCVVMVNAGQWQNFDCTYLLPFVCQKAVPEITYTRQTLLIALLVPIFSCISFAVAFTTVLLVCSVRRANQPFKQASRYAQKKTRRGMTVTWEMIDTLRRASLKRRSSKQRAGHNSIPNIEITKPDGEEKAGDCSKTSWFKKKNSQKTNSLQAPVESPNSSLYELLLRLNDMDFAHSKYNKAIELHDLKEKSTEKLERTIQEECQSVEQPQDLEEKRKNKKVRKNSERSFRNMAFRDSISSNDTVDGTVFGRAFMFGKNILEKQDSWSSNMEAMQEISPRSNPGFARKKSSSISERESFKKAIRKQSINVDYLDHEIPNTDNVDTKMKRENKLQRTVTVDVHRMSEESSLSKYDGGDKTKKKPHHVKSIVWTYSI